MLNSSLIQDSVVGDRSNTTCLRQVVHTPQYLIQLKAYNNSINSRYISRRQRTYLEFSISIIICLSSSSCSYYSLSVSSSSFSRPRMSSQTPILLNKAPILSIVDPLSVGNSVGVVLLQIGTTLSSSLSSESSIGLSCTQGSVFCTLQREGLLGGPLLQESSISDSEYLVLGNDLEESQKNEARFIISRVIVQSNND